MSGFGQSIRDWAGLGGEAGEAPPVPVADAPMSPDEIRQKRLAKMAGNSPASAENDAKKTKGAGRIDFSSPGLNLADSSMDLEVELDDNSGGVTPMEGVEEESTPYPNSGVSLPLIVAFALPCRCPSNPSRLSPPFFPQMASTMPNLSTRREQSLPIPPPTAAMSATMRAVTSPAAVERMPSSPPQPRSSPRKSHLMKLKKRDNTMNKVLHVTTVPAKASSSLVYVEVEVDHNPDDDLLGTVKADIDRNSLSAVIASRLAMAPDDAKLKAVTARERKAVYYLAGIFDRAGVESGALAGKSNEDMVLTEMLKEIQDLAVSYCASSLTVPDLFESAVAASSQLFSCLSTNSHNIASGSASSFLHRVCKELLEQEEVSVGKSVAVARRYSPSSSAYSTLSASRSARRRSPATAGEHPLLPAL